MDRALLALRSEKHFEQLKPFLTGGSPAMPYSKLAAELGVSEGVVKTRVHRLRKKYGPTPAGGNRSDGGIRKPG